MEKKLRPKQERFVAEYLVDLNASQAAIRAGYSPKRANAIGYDLLTKTDIQAALHVAMLERQCRTEVQQDDALLSLKRIKDANMLDYAAWSGDELALVPSAELTREQAYCIQEVSIDKDGRVKIKLHDKVAAALGLLKHTSPNDEDGPKKIEVEIKLIGAAGNANSQD